MLIRNATSIGGRAVVVKVLLCLVAAAIPASADGWSEAVEAARAGETSQAVELLEVYLDAGGPFSDASRTRYETQLFLWRVELGGGRSALDELLELPERSTVLEPAAPPLGAYLAEDPAGLDYFLSYLETRPEWRPHTGMMAAAALTVDTTAAARLAGINPAAGRSVLRDLADDPAAAAVALAAYGGDPAELDVVTWRVWLELVAGARGEAAAVEAARERLRLEPDSTDARLELSRRLREGGEPGAALELWAGRGYTGDNRPALERGECLFALGRTEEAVESWLELLDIPPLTTGRVRQTAGVLSDHGLFERALALLEDPPTGTFTDYARPLIELHEARGDTASAVETALELLELQPGAAWAVDDLLEYGAERESALIVIEALEGRRGNIIDALRLELALEPWALVVVETDGPLAHPLRPAVERYELDATARRLIEKELERWSEEGLPERFPLSNLHGLLTRAGALGLGAEALDWTHRLLELPDLEGRNRLTLAEAGLEAVAGCDAPVDVERLEALLDEFYEHEEAARLIARRLADGGETARALDVLEGLESTADVLSARALLLLRRGEPAAAEGLLTEIEPGAVDRREPLYAVALTTALNSGFSDQPDLEAALEPARRFVQLHGDDPRAPRLLRFILDVSLELTVGGGETFGALQRAWAAELGGDAAAERRELESVLDEGGPLAKEARLRLAELHLSRDRYTEARATLEPLLVEVGLESADRALALAAYLEADFLADREAAVELLVRLVEEHPRSVLLEYARRGLAILAM